jgi:hypothetical protein
VFNQRTGLFSSTQDHDQADGRTPTEAAFSADFRLKSKGKDYQSVNIGNS